MDFNFNIEPKITKNYLLQHFSEETYMEYYLGIKVKKGLFKSPLRRDNSPTCSFYRNTNRELIFKDFNGSFYGNFIDVVMYKYHIDYYHALRVIANDFGIIKNNKIIKHKGIINSNIPVFKDTGKAKIQVEIKDYTKKELDWWKNYGISIELLNKYKVFSCKTIFLNGNVFNVNNNQLIFGYYGGKQNGIELWRIYFPNRTNFRFLTNWSAKKIQGFEQLPKVGKILIITKSMKDTMCLNSLGLSACAPNSENLFISDNVLTNLKSRFKYIVVFYDNDLPGIHNMNKIKKDHKDLIYFYIPRKYKAKDISDFRKKYGRYKTLQFIKNNIIKYKNE